MATEDYKRTWEQLWQRRTQLHEKRSELEIELSDLRNELSHLDEIIAHLSPLAGFTDGPGSITGLGMTDAIRAVLSEKYERMSASDIYRKLQDKGFEFSSYTHPMASIYKVLGRLKEGDEVEADNENRKVFYKWKVLDEDIPF